MNITPKISVIIPVYKTEQYLKECLNSVIRQTLYDIEIIVINDGSPDCSIDIIREYERKDNRVVVIDKQNEGVGRARNDGLDKATGEFVAFMDSDDYYPKLDVLEHLYNVAKSNDVLVVGGKHQRLFDNGELSNIDAIIEEYGIKFNKHQKVNYIDYQYDYGYWTYIYNRQMLVDGNVRFPSYSRFQDPPFFVKAMTKAKQFIYLDEPVYVYREVSTPVKYSVSKTWDMLDGLADNLTFSLKNGLPKLHYLTAQRLNYEASYMIIKNLNDSSSDKLISKYLKTISLVDFNWLQSEKYQLPEPFIPELFSYMRDASIKYEKLRNTKLFRTFSKMKKK